MKTTNGKQFDDFQVQRMAEVITKRQPTGQGLIKQMYDQFKSGCDINPYYKKTPRVFTGLTVFFVQSVKAFKLAGIKINSVEGALQTIYPEAVFLYISACPDVDMSEAKRILKQTNFQP
jgi:hypothetical protein